jgi:HTH-type transcriptional regulator / antitoxin HigA
MTPLATNNFDSQRIAPAWHTLQAALPVPLGVIRNAKQLKKFTKMMDELLELIGDDEEHQLVGLLDVVTQYIDAYENKHHAIPQTEPREVLQLLMTQHDLKQADLSAEIGGQSVVSDILGGKREINVRQAKALAERFGVSAAAFV